MVSDQGALGARDMNIWEPFEIEPGQCSHWQIGPLKLWLRRIENEWQLASERQPEEEDSLVTPVSVAEPEELQWNRWSSGEEANVVQNIPVMPDRSLIVRPETPLRILQGSQALFYVTIPVWVRVAVGEGAEVPLSEESSVILSHSWLGDPVSGELCYSRHTSARRTLDELGPKPHRAICPVRVKNDAKVQLDLQRLCVRLGHLNIYSCNTHLWTNEVVVVYKGEDKPSRVEYGERCPADAGAGELISKARIPLTQGFLQRGFDTLRTYTQI